MFKKSKKSVYLSVWDPLRNYFFPITENIIATHITNKETVEALSGIELVFDNDSI